MPKPVRIDLAEVASNPERVEVKYGNKEVICKMYSMNKSTLNDWLRDMRDNTQFAHGVLNPTHKIVLINLEVFEEYIKWLDKNRYKSRTK